MDGHPFYRFFVGSLDSQAATMAFALPGPTLLHERLASDLHVAAEPDPELCARLAELLSVYSLERMQYGLRGGRPYYKSAGWVKHTVQAEPERLRNWCVAYHGTDARTALRVLAEGLRNPGTPGVRVAHGQAYSKTNASIYLTPALGYTVFLVYALLAKVTEARWVQCVLQVRVRPGSFVERPGSLRNKYWPWDVRFDADFDCTDPLEWLIEKPEDHAIVGLLVREVGDGADGSVFGDFAPRVKFKAPLQGASGSELGPEYGLNQVLEIHTHQQGWCTHTVPEIV